MSDLKRSMMELNTMLAACAALAAELSQQIAGLGEREVCKHPQEALQDESTMGMDCKVFRCRLCGETIIQELSHGETDPE
jgi:hypothetical protein